MNRSRMTTKFSVYLLLSIFLIFLLPNLATAVTQTTGDVVPAYPVSLNPLNWIIDANHLNLTFEPNYADLIIGNTGTGTLSISDGYQVTDSSGYIGFAQGSSGTVDVNDASWYNYETWDPVEGKYWGGELYVGYEGTGVMNIFNGGFVLNDANSYIGFAQGSSGTVTVTGPGSTWLNFDDLYVGYGGEGTMVISNQGYVDSWDSFIGYKPNSTGIVTVTGQASWWTVELDLFVGYEGDGTLLIEKGGKVYTGYDSIHIGEMPGSTGSVTVTGPRVFDEDENGLFTGSYQDRSTLIDYGGIHVGVEGSGTLSIEDGGFVMSYGSGYIGEMPGSTGSVTVKGPEFWQESTDEADTESILIQGSQWVNNGNLFVGYEGDGMLSIEDGGYVQNNIGYIGKMPGSRGSVTVTGPAAWQKRSSDPEDPCEIAGSQWVNNGSLYVGDSGDGTLSIENGGEVTNWSGYIGNAVTSIGSVTVTGQDSLWENSGELYVGNNGLGEMLISDGGKVTNGAGYIGNGQYSGGRVSVTGQDSLWENSGPLYVGNNGLGEMLISDGGHVISGAGIIGYSPGSRGSVTVTGTNSTWDNNDVPMEGVAVGSYGEGEMLISDGGKVTTEEGFIGSGPGSSGSVTVTGQDSIWDNSSGYLYVGGSGGGPGGTGLLNISNGGTVEAYIVYIWDDGTLSGDGSLVSNSVLNYGTIKPGNSIGTLTIDGDLRMLRDSIYEVEVDNSGNSDLLSVTGDVGIIGGTVKAVATETICDSQQYTIIEATSVSGTFETLDTALLDIGILSHDESLDYGTDSVILQIDATRFDDPSIAKNNNQSSLGRALQQIAAGGGNEITTALQNLESGDEVRDAYTQLSGQISPQLMPVAAVNTGKFMSLVSDRLNNAGAALSYYGYSSGPLLAMGGPDTTFKSMSMYDIGPYFALSDGGGTKSSSESEWGIWGRGYGAFGDRDTGGGVAGYDYTVYGTTFGLDFQITDSSLMGITAGYSDSVVDSSLPGSNSDISGTHLGIYGNKNMDEWHLDAILTGSILEYETERYVNLVGERLEGDSDGKAISGYVEARYDWRELYNWSLQPLASFQFSLLDIDSYTEDGGITGSTSALSFDDQDYNSYKGSLGMKLTKHIFNQESVSSTSVQLRGRWVHEFGDDNSSVDASFLSDPSIAFKVSDEDISRDSIVLGAGINAGLSRRTQISFGYDTQLNSDDNMHMFSGSLVYRW